MMHHLLMQEGSFTSTFVGGSTGVGGRGISLTGGTGRVAGLGLVGLGLVNDVIMRSWLCRNGDDVPHTR